MYAQVIRQTQKRAFLAEGSAQYTPTRDGVQILFPHLELEL